MSDQLRQLLDDHGFWIFLNANDVWGWACADACRIDIEEDLDKLLAAEKRFGYTGILAFMSLAEGREPQQPILNKTPDFEAAKEWCREHAMPGKDSGWKSAADENRDAKIKRLRTKLTAAEARVRVLGKALADCMEALESLDSDCLGFAYDEQSGGISWPIRDELIHKARQALGDSR